MSQKENNNLETIVLTGWGGIVYLHDNFPPYFEMFLPEGYLFEIFKQLIMKEYGELNDYLLFSFICENIEGRITFESKINKKIYTSLNLDDVLNNDNKDTFNNLLSIFLKKNAISGVQPKTIALLKDKENLQAKEYILKTWKGEYPYLAENEYFCMQVAKKAGVNIPNLQLSKNKNFLLVEKFTFDKKNNKFLGFEEVLCLMKKNKDKKYQGSYEQVAKIIYGYSTNKKESMKQFFKTIIVNYLVKNGDAHLKNFGVLYEDDFSNIRFAPAYDIVNTTVYVFKDKPALALNGKKIWFGKKELIDFGEKACFLSRKEAKECYEECLEALKKTIKELEAYVSNNPNFYEIGLRMIDTWKLSLLEETIILTPKLKTDLQES